MKKVLFLLVLCYTSGVIAQTKKPESIIYFAIDSTGKKWNTVSRSVFKSATPYRHEYSQKYQAGSFSHNKFIKFQNDSADRLVWRIVSVFDSATFLFNKEAKDSVVYDISSAPSLIQHMTWDTAQKIWVTASGYRATYDYSGAKGTVKKVLFEKYDAPTTSWLFQNEFRFNADTAGNYIGGGVYGSGSNKLADLKNIKMLPGSYFKPTNFTVEVNVSGNFVPFYRVQIHYNWRQQMLDSIVENYDILNSKWVMGERNRYEYDTFGHKTLSMGEAYLNSVWEPQNGTKDSIIYDKDGNFLEEYISIWNTADNRWDKDSRKIYGYTPVVFVEEKEFTANSTKIFPIPATDILHVDLKTNTEKSLLLMYDISGRKISEETFTGSAFKDISSFKNGLYMLKIISGTHVQSTVIVKQ